MSSTNVSKCPVAFDHHSTEYAQNYLDILRKFRTENPVAKVADHGGFYLLTRYKDVVEVAGDDQTFASYVETPEGFLGVTLPSVAPIRGVPAEMQPPISQKYRRLMSPFYSPKAVRQWEPFVLDCVTACIDEVIESGSIDLILDLGNPVPAILTCKFLGLDVTEWRKYAEPLHWMLGTVPGTEANTEAVLGAMWILESIMDAVAARKAEAEPRDDFIGFLAHAQIDGEPIPEEFLLGAIFFVIGGGVDTTTSLLAHALRWLGDHPVERQRLIDDPSLMPVACEEFLRYFTPVHSIARTVTRETEVGGVPLCPGDRVVMSWPSANRDETVFEQPDELILDRSPNRHTSFAIGSHYCLGAHFARMDFTIMLQEVLRRMPDYVVDKERAERYPSLGQVDGYARMPATFTPGPRLGSTFKL